MTGRPDRHGRRLYGLAAVFALRVAAQPLATLTGWAWLPGFDTWQSGALPYTWLLVLQLVLLGWMLGTAHRIGQGRLTRSGRWGRTLAIVAGLYGGVMVTRLLLGLTWFRGHWWLDAPLPTLFHLVITTFLAVAAHYHLRDDSHHSTRS